MVTCGTAFFRNRDDRIEKDSIFTDRIRIEWLVDRDEKDSIFLL